MTFSDLQKDALAEIIHIGYGRAAAALSAMTHERVQLEVPRLELLSLTELRSGLGIDLGAQVVSVNQGFVGPISGNAMLLLEQSAAVALSKVLDETAATQALDGHSGDIVTEVGNILLNACLGVFGSLLHVQMTFAVPSLRVSETLKFFESIVVENQSLTHAVVVQTRFTLRDANVTGALLIVLGVTSLERISQELANW